MSWKRLKCTGSGPSPRGGHSASFVDGDEKKRIAIFGGSDRRGEHFNDMHILEFPSNCSSFKWLSIPASAAAAAAASASAPPARSGHSSVAYNNALYVFGGQCVHILNDQEQKGEFFSDVWKFDLATNAWSQLQTTGSDPKARNAHTANLIGNKMFVIGGSNDDGPEPDVAILDLDSLIWETISPRSFEDFQNQQELESKPAAARIADGTSKNESSTSDEKSASFEPSPSLVSPSKSSNSSQSTSSKSAAVADEDGAPSVPEAREMHSAVAVGSSILMFGGRTSETICDHFYEFLSESRSWRLHDRCLPLCGHGSVAFGQRVIHFGGTDCQQLFDSVQVFNTHMLVWTEPRDMSGPRPKPRMALTLTQISPSQAILFGGAGMESEFNDVFLLTDGNAFSHGKQS